MQQVTSSKKLDFDIYLFINTKSGGRAGARFMQLQMDTVKFRLDNKHIDVSFFNLNETSSKVEGLEKLKMSLQKGQECRCIVCGGDGTVLWVVKEMAEIGIDIHKVPVGIIPIGTGNDFSRAMGWGGKQQTLIGDKFEKLKSLIVQWIEAQVVNFDVWQIELFTHENGSFEKIKDKQVATMEGQYFRKPFTNYFSIGIDARIGFSFDKYRGQTRAMNYLIYSALGLAKFFDSSVKMNQFITKMWEVREFTGQTIDANKVHEFPEQSMAYSIDEEGQQHVSNIIFDNTKKRSHFKLKPGYQNIVALNINSYMGGCTNMWRSTTNIAVTNKSSLDYYPQSECDGILEFLSWKSELGLALQRVAPMASKVAQGPGPFEFSFQRSYYQDLHTFIQVDGEFFKVYHPKTMIIRRSPRVPKGYIKVLKNKGSN